MMITKIASAIGVIALSACVAQPSEQGQTPQEPTALLAGSEWSTDMDGQFIQFGVGGKVSGNGGCNRFGGAYVQDGNVLSFGPLMSTKMACVKLSEEQMFFEFLAKTKQAEISHLTLVLKDEAGEKLISLKRRDWD